MFLADRRCSAGQFPNSYHSTNPATRAPAFAGHDVAEAPYQVGSNIVSRQSPWVHEGQPDEYDQVRELYQRVMTQQQKENLHKNTAKLLRVSSASTPARGVFTDPSCEIVCGRYRSARLSHTALCYRPQLRHWCLRSPPR